MGIVKEPLDVDFVVDSRTLTRSEEEAISAFIRADKAKREEDKLRAESIVNQKSKEPA